MAWRVVGVAVLATNRTEHPITALTRTLTITPVQRERFAEKKASNRARSFVVYLCDSPIGGLRVDGGNFLQCSGLRMVIRALVL